MFARLKAAGKGWVEDDAGQMGASLAYYTLFSLTPLLVLAIAVIGSMVGEAGAKEHVVAQVREFLGKDSADGISGLLEHFQSTKARVGTSIVGFLSILFGATGMFTGLRSSLNRIWRLPPARDGIIAGLVKTYLLAVVMVFVSCVFLIALLLASTAMPFLSALWAREFPTVPWSPAAADFTASTLLLTLLFAFTFRFLSDGRLPYRSLWGGAFVSALLFTAGKMVIGVYLAYANLASVYGAAGSIMVFLAWVYYSAQIFFFGAEVIRAGRAGPGANDLGG